MNVVIYRNKHLNGTTKYKATYNKIVYRMIPKVYF